MIYNFPYNDLRELAKIERGFAQYSYGRLRGCVMAVDGWVCRTRPPYQSEVENVKSFYNRKGTYGLVILAGVDSKCKFLMFSSQSSGSTNDCVAWEFSNIYQHVIKENRLPSNYYFIGDEGFVNTRNFLTPHSGCFLNLFKDSFNYHLSRMRQNVERAFGILVSRWGIYWRPLSCDYDRWRLILQVTARLHNLCLDLNIEEQEPLDEDMRPHDINEVLLNHPGFDVNLDTYEGLNLLNEDPLNRPMVMRDDHTRDLLTESLREQNVLRPAVY
jgi:hypothetical protein